MTVTYDQVGRRVVISANPGGAGHVRVSFDAHVPGVIVTPPGTGVLVTTFALNSAAGGVNLPFTVGQVFKQGDIKNTEYITSDIAEFQADIRNRWQDGSVKFAVLSGRQTLSAGIPTTVQVQKIGTPLTGTNKTEADLTAALAAGGVCSVALSGFGTVALAGLVGTAALVRAFLGVHMSEFHYRSGVGSDPHLAVWFFVRLYNGNIEIETCVENGYMKVASPVDKSYTATVTINGVQRYNAALVHWPRTRWMTVNWFSGGTSGLTDFTRVMPSHNVAYLLSTKMVPNYSSAGLPSATTLNGFTQNIVPLGNGNLQAGDIAGTGAAPNIGLLAQWDAAYCVSGDSRAFRAMLANTYASNSWPIAYRDESTQRPYALTTRPNLDKQGWNLDPVVGGTGSNANAHNENSNSHHPSAGYLAYLMTGRWTCLETIAFWATAGIMTTNPNGRKGAFAAGQAACFVCDSAQQPRGMAWGTRSCVMTCAIYPDSGPTAADLLVKTDLVRGVGNAFINYQNNNLGIPMGHISYVWVAGDYVGQPAGGWANSKTPASMFQGCFVAQSVGFCWDLDVLVGSAKTAHQACRDHFYKWPIGLLGDGGAAGWCYRWGLDYTIPVGTQTPGQPTGTGLVPYASWAAAWAAAVADPNAAALLPGYAGSCSLGSTIVSGNWPDATSYGGNMMPAICYAVDHGAPGAANSYDRLVKASNIAAFIASQPAATQWATLPRVPVVVTPPPPVGAFYQTDFLLTENPISEGGIWTGGLSDGLDWRPVQTIPGRAFAGTFNGGNSEYNDPTAHLKTSKAAFSPNHYVQSVVYVTPGYAPGINHEVEHLLRFAITPHNARGYEVLWAYWNPNPSLRPLVLVRWEGPLGSYTELARNDTPGFQSTGVIMRTEIVGQTIKAYINGVLKLQYTDTGGWATGQPGMGFWPRPGATLNAYGFSHWEAGDL